MLIGPLRRGASVACGLALAGVVAGCSAEPSAEVAVREFLLAWQEGDYEQAAERTTGNSEEVTQALHDFHDHLDVVSLRLALGPIDRDGDAAQASFEAVADLGIGDPVWSYEGRLDLARIDGRWVVDWSPSVVHPVLDEGERLAVTYEVPERGQILDHEGERLVDTTEVVAFGVRPADMPDVEVGVAAFASVLEEESTPFLSRVRSAPPDEFQPLVLMRSEDADRGLIGRVGDIEGAETQEQEMLLAPRTAPAVVGEVAGTDEHNISQRVAGAYQAGDTVGLSGLQSAYQQRLAGTATTHIVTLDEDGEHVDLVERWPGQSSGTVETTLDAVVQEASESALEAAAGSAAVRRASLVAVDAEGGEIRAAATHPGGVDNTQALTAEYAPGNAFTIISTTAMLRSGKIAPEDAVGCGGEQQVGDYSFENLSGPPLWGEADFTQVFANSCTNGFVVVAEDLAAEELEQAATDFGIGAEWDLPVDAYSGEFDHPQNDAERVAAAVGEDKVTVSPLAMAVAAAAVADGTRRSPVLVAGSEAEAQQDEIAIEAETLEPLRELMRAAVVQGSAAGANAGTLPVHGQAATVPGAVEDDALVQWFVGYQGGLAFAVAVEIDPDYRHLAADNSNRFALNVASGLLLGLPEGHVAPTAAQQEQQDEQEQDVAPGQQGSEGQEAQQGEQGGGPETGDQELGG